MPMKLLSILLFCLLSGFGYAQRYDNSVKKCLENFHEGLSKFSSDKVQEEMERRYEVLNQCIRGHKFPDFTITSHKGIKFSSRELEGKVALINFWFTKSPTSTAAIPFLNELVEEYKDQDFILISFATDGFAVLSEFLKEHPVNYIIFEKSRNLINHQFSTLIGYPTNIFLNKKGEVVEYRVGGSVDESELAKTKEDFKRIIDYELEN